MNYSKIKLLYYNSQEIKHNDILWGLIELGVDVSRSEFAVTHNIIVDNEVQHIIDEIPSYDIVMTQNFSVNVAEACHLCNKTYISWIYDSPQIALYTDYALYDENLIFSFDKIQVLRLKELGIKHVFYQPLAANTRFQSTIALTPSDYKKYTSDVSFVGQLYRKDSLDSFFSLLSDERKELFLKYCTIYSGKWNNQLSIFDDTLDEYVKMLIPYILQSEFDYYHMDPVYLAKCMYLCPFITQFERIKILTEISKNFDSVIYTSDKDYEYAKSFFLGKVFPHISREESFKLFGISKLNINITLRTIESGIPLRVFDVMGMGGAVVTNWQPEVMELFVPEKEIIVYDSFEELIDKINFYLNNDSIRNKIASNGKNRVLRDYNMVNALKSILRKSI